MSVVLHLIRLALVLVLWTGPLVSSAFAAEAGVWSSAWADPFSGTIPPAEEEEPTRVEPEMAKEEALLSHADLLKPPVSGRQHVDDGDVPPEAPHDGAPTPPPDAR